MADILTALVAGGPDSAWPDLLVRACRTATRTTGVGLALVDDAGLSGILAATDGLAQRLEDLQFELGEGPCLEATRSGRPVFCSDLGRDGPSLWPAFTPDAAAAGLASAFTFPLQAGAIPIGVLDLYRDTAGPFWGPDLEEAIAYADAAVAVLLHLQEKDGSAPDRAGGSSGEPEEGTPPAARTGAWLLALTERRAVVHQAVGMISVQLGVSLTEALLRLRAHAWAQDRPITEVAADVVARRFRFDDSDEGTTDGPGSPDPGGSPTRGPQ